LLINFGNPMLLSLVPKFCRARLRTNPWRLKAPYAKQTAGITDFIRQSL
jgi:hypothetical protein